MLQDPGSAPCDRAGASEAAVSVPHSASGRAEETGGTAQPARLPHWPRLAPPPLPPLAACRPHPGPCTAQPHYQPCHAAAMKVKLYFLFVPIFLHDGLACCVIAELVFLMVFLHDV